MTSSPAPSLRASADLSALAASDPYVRDAMHQALRRACSAGAASSVAAILPAAALDIDELSSLVSAACYEGDGCLKELIKAGARITQEDLSVACDNANPKAVRVLLAAGLKATVPADLALACGASMRTESGPGAAECVEELLKAGALPSAAAMEEACYSSEGGGCVKALLKGGFPPRRPKMLGVALDSDNFEGALALLSAGCPADYNMALAAIDKQRPELVYAMALSGMSLGISAESAGLIGVASLRMGDANQRTLAALFDAHAVVHPEPRHESARRKAAFLALSNLAEKVDRMTLSDSAENAPMRSVRELLKRADLTSASDHKKLTELALATWKSATMRKSLAAFFTELYNHGADPCAVDDQGRNAAHYASERAEGLADLSALAKMKVNLSLADKNGFTPLHLVAPMSNAGPKVARWLIAKGADPNAKSANGTTPLMAMVRAGSYDTAMALIGAGAKPLSSVAAEIRKKKLHQSAISGPQWAALAGLCEAQAQRAQLLGATAGSKKGGKAPVEPAVKKRLAL